VRDLLSIHHALELIEARLRDEMSVAEMAEAAGYSLYHFIRTFNQIVYHTPYNYLVRRRLSEAAYELIHSNRRVIDIALGYRFGNPETFSRAFKRLFGMQPSQWRDHGVLPHQGLMPPLSLAYLEHIHRSDFQKPEISNVPARCVIGLMARLSGQPGEVEQLWCSLGRSLEMQPPMKSPASFFGVISYLEGAAADSFYLAAVETSAPSLTAPHLVNRILPEGKYVRMTHCGPAETLPLTLTYLYHTWLPRAGLQPSYPLEIMALGEIPPWRKNNIGTITVWLLVR
jgi:AraC family transcriptional regulator